MKYAFLCVGLFLGPGALAQTAPVQQDAGAAQEAPAAPQQDGQPPAGQASVPQQQAGNCLQPNGAQTGKPSLAKDAGSAVASTGGQLAGAAVAGPIGAAVGWVVVNHVGHAVKKVLKGKHKGQNKQAQACAAPPVPPASS